MPNMLEIVPQGVDKWAGVQVRQRHSGRRQPEPQPQQHLTVLVGGVSVRTWRLQVTPREGAAKNGNSFACLKEASRGARAFGCTGAALRAQVLLKHLDLTPAQFMAVGDGGNDLEMVRGVRRGLLCLWSERALGLRPGHLGCEGGVGWGGTWQTERKVAC